MKKCFFFQLTAMQNAKARDNVDNITKSENKTLKFSLSANKTRMSELELEVTVAPCMHVYICIDL